VFFYIIYATNFVSGDEKGIQSATKKTGQDIK
jgi:hypothetical protein